MTAPVQVRQCKISHSISNWTETGKQKILATLLTNSVRSNEHMHNFVSSKWHFS
jgi:hypothetical protein